MTIEYETKVLDINKEKIQEKLIKLGTKRLFKHKFRRWVLDMTKDEKNDFIRLREKYDKVTLTYKKRNNTQIDGVEEIETNVTNFDTTAEILLKLNWTGKYYQENIREMYILDNIEFCLDTWPNIPTHLEIEGKTYEDVNKGLKLLNLENKDVGNISVLDIYSKHNIDLHSIKTLKFD